ncbi:putative benzoate 4-monooxygenase cytochrome p450 protein [Botrytis fragariae]|uniref:Putative benzoate 4-monooxygenase cytochrome p450 protein n=1 Tax=Botrytis fragariae TaxID=1964551 RepID=A0A8H6EPP6_9HELO|nr:putative benzoate 4-monooxygenase cytochrome p450 protein [Botrytis fragariae]KAF5879660.1 putative benzoate 4-monooxygenase cytochrome p450 protein [Botrytis fragariae]
MENLTCRSLCNAFLISVSSYIVAIVAYNAFFHPLSKFRGSPTWIVSRVPFIYTILSGILPYHIKKLHDEYDELSFTDPQAWKDIYLQRQFIRPKEWGSRPPGVEAHNFITANAIDHARFRKAFQPAFSDRATKSHEPTVKKYIDLLVLRLNEAIAGQRTDIGTVDLVQWLNFTTFDIIGDLGWGSSFKCLQESSYHPWIKVVLHFKAVLIANSIKYYPLLEAFLIKITPASALRDLRQALETGHLRVQDRLHHDVKQPDIMSHVIDHNKSSTEIALSTGEIEMNSMALIVAGSETLTTTLTAAIHFLLQDPKCLETLETEIRTNFSTEEQINNESTSSLPYLMASQGQVPSGGATIAGHFVPGGTTVSVACWSIFHSSNNFASPDEFIPERWLGDSGNRTSISKQADSKNVFHPFSLGAHNCIGQPLAWMEMRLILSRLIWNFHIQVPSGKKLQNWTNQKIFWTWDKVPLNVQLMSVEHSEDQMNIKWETI